MASFIIPNTSVWAQTCIGNMMVGFLIMNNENEKLEFVMLVLSTRML